MEDYIQVKEKFPHTFAFHLSDKQKAWLKRESEQWKVSEGQVVRSLINSRMNYELNTKIKWEK